MNTETKREKFIRIAERRVNNILSNLDSLGKCSNRKNYEYTEGDVSKIFGEIEKKIKDIKLLYSNSNKKKKRFKL
jgi:hypothetical protein